MYEKKKYIYIYLNQRKTTIMERKKTMPVGPVDIRLS